jgi:pyrroline-5-carboxylate reductase
LPNAAAEVGKSYTPWVATRDVDDRDRSIVRRIFDACGSDDEVSSENEIDYLTGLAGSGPAFPALLATAMMRAAAAHGLGPDIARRAATAVLIGAGRLLELRNEDPAETVEMFVNYRGTTAAAIAAMLAAGFEAAVANGLSAALHKSMKYGRVDLTTARSWRSRRPALSVSTANGGNANGKNACASMPASRLAWQRANSQGR